ncbi:MAG: hypothetical protein A2528_03785 [Candidatus Staskawiczbacteria bacterium RIFOXYD2_FULL_37_9]|uniref:Transcription elongation factor GreA n=1 Tax=Candidatus Staskawiczbacteria bacterium RIFOXYB1_FULL_37_44 TaxID=1802223 RepID=A0A1G2IZ41_9BACT|nr:MAG: hypothetical protein A2358_00330 [Candidatus Staskawiczbacteria bacterium RIFOXYB1_FULL_37_44]OGZ83676.1 MAG: hypothetical protein A2416_03680 [Candidatus Staskawiczbacteria bacterium RIFOXYC1_FULL_37_52]OGZ88488.1 MAG: hypothetical protein A2444_02655 [Candidatus Staskawiczbacteria bacterium RIFOXYC2_FULL_37_19]OGZ90200.1 MAG: hypothetical protein A2581_02210 [Candidatus Staskawiczbacteria bacterium RIFOXYD1_FULL_37_110]OGZ94855.1 MAG: hypothetical protein A2528_03785 [Candidatus Stask
MPQYFTKEGLQKLKDELKEIKENQVRDTKKLIAEARAFGDLKENAGYHDARDKMSFLLGRIEQLETAINEAVIKENDGTNKIQIGSKIKILFDGEEMDYEVVAPTESDILKGKISYHSPLGQNLMGKEAGKGFDYIAGNPSTGSGQAKKVKVKILGVS